MISSTLTHRRGFLGRVLAAAAALGVTGSIPAEAQPGGPDDWIKSVKGTHRCLFDFPQHKNGAAAVAHPQLPQHLCGGVQDRAGEAGAVGTFYSLGVQSSIPLAFNDAMWAKYGLGDYTGPQRRVGHAIHAQRVQQADRERPASPDAGHSDADHSGIRRRDAGARHREPAEDGHDVSAVRQRVRRLVRGARGPREGQGRGSSRRICSANLLPGVVVVPAMVIAIEKAQAAGIAYNRQ